MDTFFSLVTGFLTVYLSLTNGLAVKLETLFEVDAHVASDTVLSTSENNFIALPSQYETGGAIPDILIRNTAYQQASVIEGFPEIVSSATPLQALVNIFCTYRSQNTIRTTTGSGYFIHPSGVILTNAHVAQFLLLADIVGNSECIIRTGNPATARYTADLLYISPAWLRANASIINDTAPTGTGERDYALLYVNSALNNQPMPRTFPALPVDTNLMRVSAKNTQVVASGYPATDLMQNGATSDLLAKTATTSISELMTFTSNLADLFSIRGSIVGAYGASGGPVVDTDGRAIGLIVTRGDDELFGEGSLRAITLSYIDRTIREETGFALWQNLSGDLPYRSALYKRSMVPFLEEILRWELAS